MIKKILFLISSLLLFFPVSKVFALPSGESLSEFATNKRELVIAYVNGGNNWVSLYGNDGTGTSCGTLSSPQPNAPLSCWGNRTLSLVTYDTSYESYNLISFRFNTSTPLVVGYSYHITITYTLTSSSYSSISNQWSLDTNVYTINDFTSSCDGVNCTIDFNIINKFESEQDRLWLNFVTNTKISSFYQFNQAVKYMFVPYVRPSTNTDSGGSVDLGPLIEQNQTIINQNNQINNNLQDINDSINSDNVDDFSDTINSFDGFLEENSTITKLVTLPVTLYSSILNNINNTCTPFNLGTLYGEPLVLPCINIGNYLGGTLWGMIDLIISGFAIYAISKKFIKIFNNFSTLKEGDILDD